MALDWSKEELDHVKLVYNFIMEHPDYFENGKLTDEQLNVVDLFFYKWADVAQNELGWDLKQIVAIAASGEDFFPQATRGDGLADSFEKPGLNNNSCHCNTGILSDFCNVTAQGACEKVACVGTDNGCGWVFLQECNGRCSDVIDLD